jgi:alkylation response protein AidB-like acyl-CoA dehydrogenase
MPTPLDSESKSIIEDTLSRFVEECYDPTARHTRLNNPPIDYRKYWPTLAELGVLGMPFEEAMGGLGGCAIDTADAIRVLAKGLIFEPFVEAAVIAGSVLAAGADAAKSEAAVAELIAGEKITVKVGGRPGLMSGRPGYNGPFTAEKTPSGWRLSGKTRVVMYAAEADYWLVVAHQTESNGAIIFRVASDEVEAHIDQIRLMDGQSAADISFRQVDLTEDAVWLMDEAASAANERANLHAVSAYAADAVGCMAQLLKITGEYLKTRVQFGVPIGTFQALQHRFADMHMVYMEARAMSRSLATCLDGGALSEQRWRCFSALSVVTAAGTKVGHESIQMHGGMGVTDELIVSHYNARLLTLARQIRYAISHDITPPPLATARKWI